MYDLRFNSRSEGVKKLCDSRFDSGSKRLSLSRLKIFSIQQNNPILLFFSDPGYDSLLDTVMSDFITLFLL